MPIKFRCSYCRQFLGISRAKAGELVDCPTCGRSIRVPGLDGIALPVASVERDQQDSKLIRALDELANWNAAEFSAIAAPLNSEETEIPQPIAEPIPIEVPIAPQPVLVKSPVSVMQAADDAEVRMNGPAMDQALAELNQLAVAIPTHEVIATSQIRTTQWANSCLVTALLVTGISLAAFGLGWWLRSENSPPASPLSEDKPEVAVPEVLPAITGRISYRTADGSTLPDEGARILVLPLEREGKAKLPVDGFGGGDDPADRRVARAALMALGGDFFTADAAGQFAITLPNPGTFQIVVISRHVERGPSVVEPELVRSLSLYFDQPNRLLGQTKVQHGQVRYKGAAPVIWDHAF